MSAGLLVVDDEKNIRRTLRMVLEGEGHLVREAGSVEEAQRLLDEELPDLVLTDVRLPGRSGIEWLQALKANANTRAVPVLVLSGHASVSEAVEAVRLGAADFFEKPLDRERVLVSVRNALRAAALDREVRALRAREGVRDELLGEAPAMRALYAALEKVAPTRGRVLILGESGTGKELVARAIHRGSPRAQGPFVKVNCAAIPAELVESELFGHERGAFTGAVSRKRGHFEAAHGGTLFLDEVGDMPLGAQAKVLRALQSGEVQRVGSEHAHTVDVRVLAATHRDLAREVAAGRFREDLYHRLNVVPLRTPPLRERREDIPLLATVFVRELCDEYGYRRKRVAPAVLDALARRSFPGNVRELRNLCERMVILSNDELTLADLPPEPATTHAPGAPSAAPELDEAPDEPASATGPRPEGARRTLREHRDAAEREYIVETLRVCDGNISRAASLLGLERTHLHKRMRALGVTRDE